MHTQVGSLKNYEIFGFKDLETNLKKIKMFETIFKEIFNSYSLLKRRDGCFELF